MPVRVERRDRVLTVIHWRPEARNAVDPEHADALYHAFGKELGPFPDFTGKEVVRCREQL